VGREWGEGSLYTTDWFKPIFSFILIWHFCKLKVSNAHSSIRQVTLWVILNINNDCWKNGSLCNIPFITCLLCFLFYTLTCCNGILQFLLLPPGGYWESASVINPLKIINCDHLTLNNVHSSASNKKQFKTLFCNATIKQKKQKNYTMQLPGKWISVLNRNNTGNNWNRWHAQNKITVYCYSMR
jgi:hypothetical protein